VGGGGAIFFPNVRTHDEQKAGSVFAYQTGRLCLLFKDGTNFLFIMSRTFRKNIAPPPPTHTSQPSPPPTPLHPCIHAPILPLTPPSDIATRLQNKRIVIKHQHMMDHLVFYRLIF